MISVSSEGEQGDGDCLETAVSADGRFVAFSSKASNLVPGDTNEDWDVFVRDREAGTTERVSINSSGAQAEGASGRPAISADGRLVAFVSTAPNLVAGDKNDKQDVFLRDRQEGKTERVSVGSDGSEGDDDSSWFPAISADGRFVVFVSLATNLVPDDANSRQDVFVRDRREGKTERVNISSSGEEANGFSGWITSISGDGRFVVFSSNASNLASEDENGASDVFLRDRVEKTTTRLSVTPEGGDSDGNSALATMSTDGRFVAFISEATNLVEGDTNNTRDVFIHDRTTHETKRVSVTEAGEEGNGPSAFCALSADGSVLAFHSAASNLVPGDTNDKEDVFALDRSSGKIHLVSVCADGKPGDGDSLGPAVSGDGQWVAFLSSATNLVEKDSNGAADIFVTGTGGRGAAQPEKLTATDD
jgi:Tol biopolymer transport system component